MIELRCRVCGRVMPYGDLLGDGRHPTCHRAPALAIDPLPGLTALRAAGLVTDPAALDRALAHLSRGQEGPPCP